MKELLTSLLFIFPLAAAGQARQDTTQQEPACPVCGKHDQVIRIQYGKPTRATVEKAEKGEIKLGGCRVNEASPGFYCKRDRRNLAGGEEW